MKGYLAQLVHKSVVTVAIVAGPTMVGLTTVSLNLLEFAFQQKILKVRNTLGQKCLPIS